MSYLVEVDDYKNGLIASKKINSYKNKWLANGL